MPRRSCGVGTGAARDEVVVGTPFQQIVALVGEQIVVAGAAQQRVVALAVEDRVAAGPTVQHVIAVAAAQVIDAAAAGDGVVPVMAVEHVRAVVARDGVAFQRAQHVLDAGEEVAVAVGLRRQAEPEIDGDAGPKVDIGHGVGAQAAVDDVGSRPRVDRVIAAFALDDVAAGVGHH